MEVIDPELFVLVPVRSIRVGIKDITEGGYPLEVGCSPSANPNSLWACATRVKESVINNTFFPFHDNILQSSLLFWHPESAAKAIYPLALQL